MLPEQLAPKSFISGHFGYSYARPLLPGRYAFTFLRDPVERVLSFYYYCRSGDPSEYGIYRLAHEHSLPDFLAICLGDPFCKMQVWNNQVWEFAYGYTPLNAPTINDFSPDDLLALAMNNLDEFSHVGLTETFDVDAAIICRALGFPRWNQADPLPKENVTPRRGLLAEQPTALRALLARITELDQALYEHVLAVRRQKSSAWWRR